MYADWSIFWLEFSLDYSTQSFLPLVQRLNKRLRKSCIQWSIVVSRSIWQGCNRPLPATRNFYSCKDFLYGKLSSWIRPQVVLTRSDQIFLHTKMLDTFCTHHFCACFFAYPKYDVVYITLTIILYACTCVVVKIIWNWSSICYSCSLNQYRISTL